MVLGRYRFMLESQGITWSWEFLSSASQIPSPVITLGISSKNGHVYESV